jgi:hypothetical protein
MEKEFANGIWFNKKRENAPEFVLGSLSISKKSLLEWLEKKQPNEKTTFNNHCNICTKL